MNRVYFGDTRDLFKFDLIRHLMKSMPELARFAFVPMLTETKERISKKKSPAKDLKRAWKTGKAGSQNKELVGSMERLQEIEDDLEYFNGVREYFQKEKILVDIMERPRFTHEKREHYFQHLFDEFPARSLIFLDPDTGLEESSPTQKHLLLDELKKIYKRMDTGSIIMIYQHFPRATRAGYIKRRCEQLTKLTGVNPVIIMDTEIAFFLSTKNEKLRISLEQNIENYANSYPALESAVCA
ncbi:MAG: hypothetical protein WC391_00320 [Methanoregula sp.]|jgi:hypothetical protein